MPPKKSKSKSEAVDPPNPPRRRGRPPKNAAPAKDDLQVAKCTGRGGRGGRGSRGGGRGSRGGRGGRGRRKYTSPETVEDSEAEEDNSIEDAEQPSGDEDEEGEGESLGGSDEDEADAKADHRYAEADYSEGEYVEVSDDGEFVSIPDKLDDSDDGEDSRPDVQKTPKRPSSKHRSTAPSTPQSPSPVKRTPATVPRGRKPKAQAVVDDEDNGNSQGRTPKKIPPPLKMVKTSKSVPSDEHDSSSRVQSKSAKATSTPKPKAASRKRSRAEDVIELSDDGEPDPPKKTPATAKRAAAKKAAVDDDADFTPARSKLASAVKKLAVKADDTPKMSKRGNAKHSQREDSSDEDVSPQASPKKKSRVISKYDDDDEAMDVDPVPAPTPRSKGSGSSTKGMKPEVVITTKPRPCMMRPSKSGPRAQKPDSATAFFEHVSEDEEKNRRRSAIFLDAANDDETSNAGDDAGDSSEAEPEPEVVAPSKDKGKGVARPEIINAHGQEDTRTRKDNGQGDAHAQEDAHTPEDAPEDAPTPEDQLPSITSTEVAGPWNVTRPDLSVYHSIERLRDGVAPLPVGVEVDWKRDIIPTPFPTENFFDIYPVNRLEVLELIANAGDGIHTANIGCADYSHLSHHHYGRTGNRVLSFQRQSGEHKRVIAFMVGIVLSCNVIEATSTNFGDSSKDLTYYKSIELGVLDCDHLRFGPTIISALGYTKATISLAPVWNTDPNNESDEVTVGALPIRSAWSPKTPHKPGPKGIKGFGRPVDNGSTSQSNNSFLLWQDSTIRSYNYNIPLWDGSHKMANPRLMTDSDGFDVNDPFKLPRMREDMQPFDLALVYFTVSSRPYRPPPGERNQSQGGFWGGAASAPRSSKSKDGSGGRPLDIIDFNLFGAVKLASRSDV